jgi:hypothetical protein
MKTLNEQIQRLRDILHTCYESIASKGGTLPPVGERNMTNLPDAVESVPQVIGAALEELTITANGEYTPQEGVDGFSKVTAEFDTSSLPKVKVTSFTVNNDCINEEGRWGGENFLDMSLITDFGSKFSGCNRMVSLDLSKCDLSNVTSFYFSFKDCTSLEELSLNIGLTTTNVRAICYGCRKLRTINTTNWHLSNVTTARTMFYECSILENIDTENFGFDNVADIAEIFLACNKLKSIDATKWNLGKVNGTASMFGGCMALQSLIGNRTIDDVLANNIGAFNGLKVDLSLNNTVLDRASLRALINGLADLTGQTTQTLTLGATLMAKLTEEDIAIATNKNWTLS